jgi:hypothetical protein
MPGRSAYLAAKGALVDLAVLGAREGQAVVLQLPHRLGRLPAHVLNSVLQHAMHLLASSVTPCCHVLLLQQPPLLHSPPAATSAATPSLEAPNSVVPPPSIQTSMAATLGAAPGLLASRTP